MDYDARVRHGGGGGVCFGVNMAWRFVNYFRLTQCIIYRKHWKFSCVYVLEINL